MVWLSIGKRGPSVASDVRLSEAEFVVIDTELTGLDERNDSIVSLGAVRMHGGRIDIGERFSRIVNPRASMSEKSMVIHEILPSDVKHMPAIDDVLDAFLSFCGQAVVIGHCVDIDITFLNKELMRHGRRALTNMAVDTTAVFSWLRRRLADVPCFVMTGRPRLYELARCFDISNEGAHNALSDAFITAQVFQRMMPLLASVGIQTVLDLLNIGHPFRQNDIFRASEEICNL